MSLLLAMRLECHLNGLTVNANQMRWSFIGPSWGRPLYFSWAVSINGASDHYADGLWIFTCPHWLPQPFCCCLVLYSCSCPACPGFHLSSYSSSPLCLSLHLVLVTHPLHDIPFTSNLLTSSQQQFHYIL